MALFVVSGCSVARGAPSQREVLANSSAEGADFVLEIVARDRLPAYNGWGKSNGRLSTSWPSGGAVPTDQVLAPGDRLSLRIWDAEESSLIASADSPFADVANVLVSASGRVSLPYIDEVQVGGLTLEQARLRIQSQLTAIIPSAQVQAEVSQGRRNSAQMLGGVANPGAYPLNERNLPLTSLIAAAGGINQALVNPQVQITRGQQVFRRPLGFVLDSPAHDPAIRGGDSVLIESDRRTFKALGAAQREEIIGFDAEDVSALRAISLMGGIADTRADPRGILVLRRYTEAEVARAGGAPNTRVVFSFDLTKADGMFSADEFLIADGDIVLATQAPAVTTQRVLTLFGAILGFGRAVGAP
ncbi:polysaccharide biosynthesis/export family protein [Roseinatronobacter bogoriensis]|uniref:Polysaccharide biosynthesis protein n=1 Tax=Roseinatronobacter bogoriensis subsp. barguzinensis TaxID=441209 RepID=A0A2K8KD77_9RHOB|nr:MULTISPECIES: polysaccharide biosynthesis/export family protein [Rhodobaca]ATX67407.1 polysaccharide biosynthesis protein [Rhodobaca barguzinensis]TDW36080.1 polysaccharide export outer membrane protein [Rhodobaca barguzinensis]TDY74093.1 polysaccharide export outer membrane protein [Rhodobaca bogoriensis DSM 18756]